MLRPSPKSRHGVSPIARGNEDFSSAVQYATLATEPHVLRVAIPGQYQQFVSSRPGEGLHAVQHQDGTPGAGATPRTAGGHGKPRFQALPHQRSMAAQHAIAEVGPCQDGHFKMALTPGRPSAGGVEVALGMAVSFTSPTLMPVK